MYLLFMHFHVYTYIIIIINNKNPHTGNFRKKRRGNIPNINNRNIAIKSINYKEITLYLNFATKL